MIRVASGLSASARSTVVGELLVVDDGVDAFALHDLRQRGPGERRVQQQHVGTDPVGGDQRLDEAAVVACHDADDLRSRSGGDIRLELPAPQILQCGGESIGALVDFAPGQRAELVDETRPVGAALRGGGESRCDAHVFALHRRGDPHVLVGPHRREQAGAAHRRDDAERFREAVGDGHGS